MLCLTLGPAALIALMQTPDPRHFAPHAPDLPEQLAEQDLRPAAENSTQASQLPFPSQIR